MNENEEIKSYALCITDLMDLIGCTYAVVRTKVETRPVIHKAGKVQYYSFTVQEVYDFRSKTGAFATRGRPSEFKPVEWNSHAKLEQILEERYYKVTADELYIYKTKDSISDCTAIIYKGKAYHDFKINGFAITVNGETVELDKVEYCSELIRTRNSTKYKNPNKSEFDVQLPLTSVSEVIKATVTESKSTDSEDLANLGNVISGLIKSGLKSGVYEHELLDVNSNSIVKVKLNFAVE